MRWLSLVALLVAAGTANATPDDAFRAHVLDYAKTTHRTLGAWGTAKLDGTKPYRFAVLDEGGETNPSPYYYACSGHECRAELLVELAPDKIVLVAFEEDNGSPAPHLLWRVMSWDPFHWVPEGYDAEAAKPADWRVLDDPAFRFKVMHNHGAAEVLLGLHGGALVVFEVHDVNSRQRDQDITFATEGVCAPACPTLASFQRTKLAKRQSPAQMLVDMYMRPIIVGPTTWSALSDPPP
jgi:hypothetical protein